MDFLTFCKKLNEENQRVLLVIIQEPDSTETTNAPTTETATNTPTETATETTPETTTETVSKKTPYEWLNAEWPSDVNKRSSKLIICFEFRAFS